MCWTMALLNNVSGSSGVLVVSRRKLDSGKEKERDSSSNTGDRIEKRKKKRFVDILVVV